MRAIEYVEGRKIIDRRKSRQRIFYTRVEVTVEISDEVSYIVIGPIGVECSTIRLSFFPPHTLLLSTLL